MFLGCEMSYNTTPLFCVKGNKKDKLVLSPDASVKSNSLKEGDHCVARIQLVSSVERS